MNKNTNFLYSNYKKRYLKDEGKLGLGKGWKE